MLVLFFLIGRWSRHVVWVSALQQCESALHQRLCPPSWACLPSPHHALLGHHRAPSWVPCDIRQFSARCLVTHGSVYMSVLPSQFGPPPPPHAVSASLFSASASLFLPCKQGHQYRFSRFHICALTYDLCLYFFTYLALYNRLWVHPPH